MWQNELQDLISKTVENQKLRISAIVGAGASVGSGLQTFRGKGGMYEGKSAQDLASPQGFRSNPELVWKWYRYRMKQVFKAKPNTLHYALVELETLGILEAVVTQNVDGLHRRAGQSDQKLIEVHGSITKTHCFENCGRSYELVKPPTHIPVVCECGSYQRPSVVWFGESLNVTDFDQIEDSLANSNLLLIIGTSGQVMPVASFPLFANRFGAKLVDFNIEQTLYQDIVDVFVKGPVEHTMPEFVEIVKTLI